MFKMDNKNLSHVRWKCQCLCGYLRGKSILMIYDRYPELQSKWDKAFWARGYYVSTIGNITEDAIKKYKRTGRRVKKRRFKKYRFLSGTVTMFAMPALLNEHVIAPYKGLTQTTT